MPPADAAAGREDSRRGARSLGWSALFLVVSRASAVVAVPLILDRLGANLYAVWVLAGTLVMSQGLIDLGFASVLIRYSSVGMAQDSRRLVAAAIRRAGWFYLGLSVAVGVPLWLESHALVSALPYISGHGETADAEALVRYSAVAFGLTNVIAVCSGALQGLDHVGPAFRGQTLGWLLYLPVLIIWLHAGGDVDAVGMAWMVAYSAQIVLLAVPLARALSSIGHNEAEVPSLGSMLAMGGKWQVSSWADFATFQLPRIFSGVVLSSQSLIVVDLALRVGQAVTMPIFAYLPLVLPKAATDWARGGGPAISAFVRRISRPGMVLVVVGTAIALPLSPLAISVWVNRTLDPAETIAVIAIVAGVIAHASTGLLSSVLLATGSLRAVLSYKWRQLAAATVLLAAIGWLGTLAVALAVSVALTVPALLFHRVALRSLDVRLLSRREWRRICFGAVAVAAGTAGCVLAGLALSLPDSLLLGIGAVISSAGAALVLAGFDASWIADSLSWGRSTEPADLPGGSVAPVRQMAFS